MNGDASQASPIPGSLSIAAWMGEEGEFWPVSGDDLHTNRSHTREVFREYMMLKGGPL